jgi:octaprenyl-diphosphate synthase
MNISEKAMPDILTDVYHDLQTDYGSSNPVIHAILEDIFTRRGKGIRPLFMALVARLAGGEWEALRKTAAAVEAIHIASFLHDDVIDSSKLRRGAASLNTLYSNKVSVLFGDYMFLKAIKSVESIENEEVLPTLMSALERMVEGEIRESLNSGLIDEETYLSIIADKTASLFAASGELGMILLGGGEGERILARELGECVGMAFQIQDDILDFRGDTRIMGKQNFMDLQTGCFTLPLIHSLRNYDSTEIKNILSDGEHDAEVLFSVVKNNGGIDYAARQACLYIDRSREIVACFKKPGLEDDFDRFFTLVQDRHF